MCRRNCEVQSQLDIMPLFVHRRLCWSIEILYDRQFLLTDVRGRYSEGGARDCVPPTDGTLHL